MNRSPLYRWLLSRRHAALRRYWPSFLVLLLALAATTPPACDWPPQNVPDPVQNGSIGCTGDCTYRIVSIFPHDRGAFTQGLVVDDGVMYESTGLNGRSSVRRVDYVTGQVLQQADLAQEYFGEGITIFDDRIIMLTWRSHVGFEFDKTTLQLLRTFSYLTEGWGITHDGTRLIMSDGTSTLYFWDPTTFVTIGSVSVRDDGSPVTRLNELEYIDGEVFANVWQTDYIARIDPITGNVTGWIDCRGLLTAQDRLQPVDVLNGIAYDDAADRLFVTGKLWPKLFEIEVVPTEKSP
ncbi:MAG: glutaminyl-peptide cyclotransferase [Candidatus Hydrogenedentes bacterium]|nr:glutaminyl-peptide cyclotransferase [Candidatus Hydrogenedentota bacterium]